MVKKPTYEELEQRIEGLEKKISDHLTYDDFTKELSERYLRIFEAVPVSIVILDKNGRIKDINPYHLTHIGKEKATKEHYLKYNILDFPSVIAAGLQDEHQSVLKGKPFNLKSVRFPVTTGGRVRFFNIRGVPIFKNTDVIGAIIIHEDITEPKQTEEALVRLNKTLDIKVKERTRQLKRLNEHLVYSEERERNSLASDLHDSVAQSLGLSLSMIKELTEVNCKVDTGTGNLSKIQGHLEQAIRETRSLIYQLYPPILKDFDIDIALGFLIEESNEKYDTDFRYINNLDDSVHLIEANKITLYRAVNELIINIVKHSGSKKAEIELSKDIDMLMLKVEDYGRGFNVETINKTNFCGFGLYGLSERFKNIGGTIKIESTIGKGTQTIICIPIMSKVLNE